MYGWLNERKSDDFCRRSVYSGFSPVRLWHILEQSCNGPRWSHLRDVSCCGGDFFGLSRFSYVDSADVSASITKLLKPKCEVRLGGLPTL